MRGKVFFHGNFINFLFGHCNTDNDADDNTCHSDADADNNLVDRNDSECSAEEDEEEEEEKREERKKRKKREERKTRKISAEEEQRTKGKKRTRKSPGGLRGQVPHCLLLGHQGGFLEVEAVQRGVVVALT